VTCFPLEDDVGVCVLPRLGVSGNVSVLIGMDDVFLDSCRCSVQRWALRFNFCVDSKKVSGSWWNFDYSSWLWIYAEFCF
jgi:hypothetical protein